MRDSNAPTQRILRTSLYARQARLQDRVADNLGGRGVVPRQGPAPSHDPQSGPTMTLQIEATRRLRAVLFVDMVDSVRIISLDEAGTVAR